MVVHEVGTVPLENKIFFELGCTDKWTLDYIRFVLRDIKLFDRKQHDYGSDNIADFGEKGVLFRANDKIARLRNLHRNDVVPSNEKVEDSWADLSVYGVIARMCRAGVWPNVAR